MEDEALRREILELAGRYGERRSKPATFFPGVTPVPASGKVLGEDEFRLLVDSALDGWLTTGRFNDEFEAKLAAFIGVRHVMTVNSGSSANLVALSALTSPLLGERALKPGDEVITLAAGFPTTVNPILQNGLVPVFVDIQLPTANIDPSLIEGAISERTRAIMIAHTLGNPFDLAAVMPLVKKHKLWLVEDCCDALGATFGGRHVGTFGDIATVSFYPAHHITMGEGGAVFTSNDEVRRAAESFRDWGRDCYCKPGAENTCGKRFGWQLGELPFGYDHKYTYSHAGYNLKITDMQAAVGLAQLRRLDGFVAARRANFAYLRERLAQLEHALLLAQATPGSDPSWFGFLLTLKEDAATARVDFLKYLDQRKIGSRLLFGGNLTRQPYMQGRRFRLGSALPCTDRVMRDSLWIGLYPGLSRPMLDYVADAIGGYFGAGI
jgi:CDP-6-deoxy-D-xylo-4-hexulose-3-dehydrase